MRFLHLLASHPWSVQALIVDPAGDLSREARQQLLADHEALRQEETAPALPIYSSADAASFWTRGHPSKPVVQRLVKLAVQSLQTLQVCTCILQDNVMQHPTADMTLKVHLTKQRYSAQKSETIA